MGAMRWRRADLKSARKQRLWIAELLEKFQRLEGASIAKLRYDTSHQADFWFANRVGIAKVLANQQLEQNARTTAQPYQNFATKIIGLSSRQADFALYHEIKSWQFRISFNV